MGDWKVLNLGEFQKPYSRDIDGVTTDVMASPFDVPTAVKSSFYPQQGYWSILFRYLTDLAEPVLTQQLAPDIVLNLGRETGRVVGVQVKRVGSTGPQGPNDYTSWQARVAELLDQILTTKHLDLSPAKKEAVPNVRPENLRIARDVIADLEAITAQRSR